MSNITGPMVKALRDKTGAGMMDCKAALTETDGDEEAAIDWLRKKGLSKAAKKAGRVAAEGLIGVVSNNDVGALVEVNAETDFVARNDEFKQFVKDAAAAALKADGDLEKLLAHPADAGSMKDRLTALVAKIGENMSVRRAVLLGVSEGVVASYIHNAAAPELGKIGVLVAVKSSGDKDKLTALGKQIAMHIAAASPLALTAEHLSKEVVDRERAIHADIARQSGTAEQFIDKKIEGRMRKFYEESVLMSQVFVIDGETPIAKVVEKASKDLGTPVAIEGFVRFQVGEGIEKVESDFADEVSKMAGN
jgi:elongation factor Ts